MSNEMIPWDSSTGLDYGRYAHDRVVVKPDKVPVLHVVQAMSPEATEFETAKPGDVVLRVGPKGAPENITLGATFNGIVVARGVQFVWWPMDGDGGAPLARCIKGDPIPDGFDARDTLWPDRGGNTRADGKAGPVADETDVFIICPFKDGDIGPAALLTYSRGSKRVGQGVQQLLNLARIPADYVAVLRFFTEKVKSSEGQTYYILKAEGVGMLPPDSPLLPRLKELHDANQPHLTPSREA
jgi:hypothetical protein